MVQLSGSTIPRTAIAAAASVCTELSLSESPDVKTTLLKLKTPLLLRLPNSVSLELSLDVSVWLSVTVSLMSSRKLRSSENDSGPPVVVEP